MTTGTAPVRFAAPRSGKLRTVFIGATSFGGRCFARALELPEVEGAGVLSAPRTFSISYRPEGVTNVLHEDLGALAALHGLPFHELIGKMTDPELVDRLAAWRPDAFLVVGWYHMIPGAIRALAPCFGLHASLLPDYSGGAPLVWAMINGERHTGITLFEMDGGVDSGVILGQEREPIAPDDTIATLYARIEDAGVRLVAEHLPRLARGEAAGWPQDESRRRVVPQRGPEDGRIDWNWPAGRIYDFVRAQTRPYPGAFSTFGGETVHVWRARVADVSRASVVESRLPVGAIVGVARDAESISVRCGQDSCLEIIEMGVGGESPTPAAWLESLRCAVTPRTFGS